MTIQPGRRAFFLGARAPVQPWAQFCQRLGRMAAGPVEDVSKRGSTASAAWLHARRPEDVHHAIALCGEYDVEVAAAGLIAPDAPGSRPRLWVDASALTGMGEVDLRQGFLSVSPAERIEAVNRVLAGTGWTMPAWQGVDASLRVGEWFATASHWLPGRCADSGVQAVDVIFADGSVDQLGSFGVAATRRVGPALGRLISDLFTRAAEPDVAAWRAAAVWAPRYRLDALLPETPPDCSPVPNLAHLLLGARGSLGWVERLHLRLHPAESSLKVGVFPGLASGEKVHDAACTALDAGVKARFDPRGRFPVTFV